MAIAKYSRDNFRSAVPGLKPVRDAASANGLSNPPFLSFYYLTYQELVREVTFDRTHVITGYDVNRLPELAYLYWGDIRLWWYLGYSNGIVVPSLDMVPGKSLQIASQASIDALFAANRAAAASTGVILP